MASDDESTAVLFDMDGVIVDSERYWHDQQHNRIFPATLVDEHPDLDETTGMYYKEIYDYLDEQYETKITKREFVEIFNDVAEEIYRNRVELLDGFHEIHETLVDRGLPVAIVTSSPSAWHDIVFERFDIDVDAVITAEELDAAGKPEPDIYEKAAEVVDRPPEDCLVIEDSKNGIEAAARAGAFVVGYRSGPNDGTDMSQADLVVDDSETLHEAIFSQVAIR